ncbi:hypothetical protein PGIGA_G00259090 [Pangasianodon gigas]|uniref:Uncharacterized protein n=1 Tax=Pangasianodon gigas TaxID=30993 RepID=A0ACC5WUU0_PANGG|nr:hypothetical protein [Pangasianodon gigas]
MQVEPHSSPVNQTPSPLPPRELSVQHLSLMLTRCFPRECRCCVSLATVQHAPHRVQWTGDLFALTRWMS